MDSFFGELIKLGAAGLVIYVIASPLIKYLIERSREQDVRINNLIDNHLAKDSEKHQLIVSSLERIDQSIRSQSDITIAQITKVYPPVDFKRTASAADHILNSGRPHKVKPDAQPS